MDEWRYARLGDVAEEVTVGHVGTMASEYREAGVPFLRSQNVERFRLDLRDIKYIDTEFHERLSKSALQPNDVVTVRTGKPGATAVVPADLGAANCSDLVITRPGSSLNSRWLSYYINCAAAGYIDSQLVGAVQQHFNVGSAKAMMLHLPPLAQQQAIGEVLGAFDDKIAANRRIAIASDLLIRAIVDRIRLSSSSTLPVAKLAQQIKELASPSEIDPNLPYVGLEHIPRRSLWQDQFGLASGVTSSKWQFRRGDILFGKLRPYFHKVVVANMSGICSTDVLVCRPFDPDLAGFVAAELSSDLVVAEVTAASEGTRMPRASWSDLASVEVPWPGNSAARSVSETVGQIRAIVESTTLESASLAQFRDTILPNLLSGRLSVRHAEKLVTEVI